MMTTPLPEQAVQKTREATQALITASEVVLHDLRSNQQDLEHLIEDMRAKQGEQ